MELSGQPQALTRSLAETVITIICKGFKLDFSLKRRWHLHG
jgi:hypothetical protein